MKAPQRPTGYSINVRARTQCDGSVTYIADVRARLAKRRFAHVTQCESGICEHAVEMAAAIVVGRLIDCDQHDV